MIYIDNYDWQFPCISFFLPNIYIGAILDSLKFFESVTKIIRSHENCSREKCEKDVRTLEHFQRGYPCVIRRFSLLYSETRDLMLPATIEAERLGSLKHFWTNVTWASFQGRQSVVIVTGFVRCPRTLESVPSICIVKIVDARTSISAATYGCILWRWTRVRACVPARGRACGGARVPECAEERVAGSRRGTIRRMCSGRTRRTGFGRHYRGHCPAEIIKLKSNYGLI